MSSFWIAQNYFNDTNVSGYRYDTSHTVYYQWVAIGS